MYFEQAVVGGTTLFMPLCEFYEAQSQETRQRWDKLWMITERREAPVHPLVCLHPYRKDTTMVFHCGRPFCKGWLVIEPEENGNQTILPSEGIQDEISKALDVCFPSIGLEMEWKRGDFMINDNLSLAHYASDGTQADPTHHGLRILHRTTIVGGPETVPRKVDGRSSFKSL
eukprot:CAMPEP_0116540946 /NCGR_PEP_ID=MMETSP0397-20121206/221_1 /TAXON_ID=216820 /ORGANISM="Cyclophora tenuis, Strain ECT3854" /LENGTH=171 /DNA_ID=CAMNT_0004064857 /DNA_START=194 /DNA_END=709 /DNA_ORIENTATION=-